MDMEAGIRDDLKDCLRRCYVEEFTGTSIAGVTDEGALLKKGDEVTLYPCDTVKARQAIQASSEGFKAGLNA